MLILGIFAYQHDASACLIKDGKILGFVEEERLNREKHSALFPKNSIEYLFKTYNFKFEDIDYITFCWDVKKEFFSNLKSFIFNIPQSLNLLKSGAAQNDLSLLSRLKKQFFLKNEFLINGFSLSKKTKIVEIEHHLGHAASVFLVSEFDESAIITWDGRGEKTSILISHGKSNKIEKIKEIQIPNSLGIFYSAITKYVGFNLFDEGKTMGLSAYGNDIYLNDFNDIIFKKGETFELNQKYFSFMTHGRNKYLSELFYKKFGPPRDKSAKISQHYKDIAFAAQKKLEEIGIHIVKETKKIIKSENLCITGGVALNCIMNQKIIESKIFKNVFVQPIASDSGTSIGGPLYVYNSIMNYKRDYVFKDIYLGPDFKNEEIEKIILKNKINYYKSKDIFKETAKLISNGEIIGWFQDKMESGPRALGNRSILADPRNPNIKDKINSIIKKRESYRPFAPAVLHEYRNNFFDMSADSDYMILSANVLEHQKLKIPSVTHVDGTARVQTVKKDMNFKFWSLINEFYQISGVPILLNTSFNENEPIVCNPQEAIDCFTRTDMNYLILDNFILTKKTNGNF